MEAISLGVLWHSNSGSARPPFDEPTRDLRRELEQIQMLLGHASVQTAEKYLGTKQDLVCAPNDAIKLRVETVN